MNKKYKLFLPALFLVATLVTLGVYISKSFQSTYSDEMIFNESKVFDGNLKKFLCAVEKTVDFYKDSMVKKQSVEIDNKPLTKFFANLISSNKYFKGAFISKPDANFIIYSEQTSWVTTYDTITSDTLSTWRRLDSNMELKSEWTDTYSFFHRENYLSGLLNKLETNEFAWMGSVSELTDRKNLITLVFKIKYHDEEMITGFIFSARDISRSFLSVLKYEKPLVSIVADGGDIITPLITEDSLSVKLYNELEENVVQIVANWNKGSDKASHNYSFEKNNKIYWTNVSIIEDHIGVKGFAITLSDDDLIKSIRKLKLIYLYVAGILLLISLFLFWNYFKKYRRKSILPRIDAAEPFTNDELIAMIKKGETEFVEFKSSLRYDYREEKVNKVLEDVILKSIAAFANAKGGTLFIGVNDNLDVIGLQNDFNTLKKQDVDYFELHLRKLINNQYGIAFANEHLSITFPKISGHIICVIRVILSASPLFLKVRNKQGQEVEKFYVRSGNASQEISSLKEINEYTKKRFHSK